MTTALSTSQPRDRLAHRDRAVTEPSAAILAPVRELFRRQPIYASGALGTLALVPPTMIAMAVDGRTLSDVGIWVKPLKFEIALAIYLTTIAWFAGWLPASQTSSRWYRAFAIVVVACVAAEMIWIGGAAAYGVPSHFNSTIPAMRLIYPVMGVVAIVLTLPTLVDGLMIWRNRQSPLSGPFRVSVGLGMVLTFWLTLIAAGAMASGQSHLVGGNASDSEAFAFMGWARDGGDLRVAHFFATHALHVIPLLGLLAARWLSDRAGRLAVYTGAGLYCGLVAATLAEAYAGRPFLAAVPM